MKAEEGFIAATDTLSIIQQEEKILDWLLANNYINVPTAKANNRKEKKYIIQQQDKEPWLNVAKAIRTKHNTAIKLVP